ncbi:M48 family metallopeptidase [Aestuariispira insulae]|uniref:Peptidase M48-like protein n=1 Tax=Aestuariispira insulae TaxID=1461337 RepID=A0A3D9HWJ6_9PROT|nr:M48 family metallopeptidase [Aestuariispira insulae]RED53751.1 peptidase M48-like protein [Aestuariispira insulae]
MWMKMKRLIAAGTALSVLSACVASTQPQQNALPTDGGQVSMPALDQLEPVEVNSTPELDVNYRPKVTTDEGGWWMKMDRYEESLQTHASLVRDEDLNAYVRGVLCRLAKDYCKDIRVYVVRKPGFNASMAPNGLMEVRTGLLLRVENEAQLATVLGHELAHYYKLHSIKNWRTQRNTLDAMAFLTLGTGIIGLGATIIALGGLSSYSRSNEAEADAVGLVLMDQAGYDPAEAAMLWGKVKREYAASKDADMRNSFFASHPEAQQREKTLDNHARWLKRNGPEREIAQAPLRQRLAPYLQSFLEDELAQGDFGALEVVLHDMEEAGRAPVLVAYFKGELYRKRGDEGDLEKARDSYLAAEEYAKERDVDAPSGLYRALGLISLKEGEQERARMNFEQYLQLAPDAHDAAFIRQMLEQIS